MPSHSKQPTDGDSLLAAEEWQLRILWEQHKKKPQPSVAQRKLLAAQTGLDAKWIARWFKRVNNSASKSKLQTRTVGRPVSGSQSAAAMAVTSPPTQSIDGKSGNLTEPTSSGTGTSPSLFRATSEPTFLFSRSGVQVGLENRRSATGHAGPYHSRLQSSGWELVHPAVAPDLQANRELERPSFYPHSHGANQSALSQLPCQPHPDHLVEHSQLTATLGIVASSPVYLTSQAQAPFRHGTSSPTPNAGTGMDDVKSRNPHTSPSLTSASPGSLQTRYVHVNLASEPEPPAPASAYTELELGYPQPDLGPGPGATAVETPARVCTHLLQARAVPEFTSPAGSQLGPFESPGPLPSMYLLLFDTELDPVVDRERDERSSSSSGPLLSNDRMMEPHVTPTPISFLAKWEDMLTLERRIRSSSRNVKLLQSKRMQTVHAVEANRTKRVMTDHVPCDLGRDRCIDEQRFSPTSSLSGALEEPCKEDTTISYSLRLHSGVE